MLVSIATFFDRQPATAPQEQRFRFFKAAALCLLTALCLAGLSDCQTNSMQAITHYQYADGNGNVWQLDVQQSRLRYEPVEPRQSSSGFYDGGPAFAAIVSTKERTEIERLFAAAFAAKDEQAAQRRMGSSQIQILRGLERDLAILTRQSPRRQELEQYLQRIRQSGAAQQ
ncbi:MAG: hypothetical protein KDK39_02185 [Leptospiraceae bacterium]|nr:hypothetical protein [Leptospiraceae bacterium]